MLGFDYISIYLNDHLAGATVGVELARRTRDSNKEEEPFAAPLARLCAEIEADRESLEEVFDQLGTSRSHVKPIAGWVGEKLGRLKLNGQLRGYSPLSRVLELEGLAMGIGGKIELWKTLAAVLEKTSDVPDFVALSARGEDQRERVEELHDLAVARLEADRELAA